MSDSVLKFIPVNPVFVPVPEALKRAKQLLASFITQPSEVTASAFPQVVFVDAGQNFEAVRCPTCGAHISYEWWQDALVRLTLRSSLISPLTFPAVIRLPR